MEGVMIFELAWPYIPVMAIALYWAVAMRPLLRLKGNHAPAAQRRGRARA